MRRRAPFTGLAPVLLAAGLVACGSHPPAQPSGGSVVVFAAASLKPAFSAIGDQFKAENPGSSIDLEPAGSSELATQLTQGATADVFASADTAQMDKVAKAGLLDGDPTPFAANTLVIVTAPGNPKHVASFADLNQSGLAVVTCQQPVPCGSATHRIEDRTGVRLHPVSEELSVTEVLTKVTSGQADAGLVYVTDAQNAGDKVTTVDFPEAAGAVNTYPIAALKKAPHLDLARKFVALVTGATGQQILHRFGFAKP